MLFAMFGLGWGEIVVLSLCCVMLTVVPLAIVFIVMLTGKKNGPGADPDESRSKREEKERREAEDRLDADKNASDAGE